MDKGRVCQVLAPQDIYEFPASRFVAEFIGSINLFEGQIAATGQVFVGFIAPGLEQPLTAATDLALPPGTGVLAAIRPEKISCRRRARRGTTSFRGWWGNWPIWAWTRFTGCGCTRPRPCWPKSRMPRAANNDPNT